MKLTLVISSVKIKKIYVHHLSQKNKKEKKEAWLQEENGNKRWKKNSVSAKKKKEKGAGGLNYVTLKKSHSQKERY